MPRRNFAKTLSYDRIVSIDCGSTSTKIVGFDIRTQKFTENNGIDFPTACLYNPEEDTFTAWGDHAFTDRYTGTFLDRLPSYIPQIVQDPESYAIHDRALAFYFQALGQSILKSARCEHSKIRYIFTTPYDWTDKEKNYIKTLFINADMIKRRSSENLSFYTESDAIFHYIQRCSDISLKKGSSYILCDVGGTTIKMKRYRMNKPFRQTSELLHGLREQIFVDAKSQEHSVGNMGASSLLSKMEELLLDKLEFRTKQDRLHARLNSKGMKLLMLDTVDIIKKFDSSKSTSHIITIHSEFAKQTKSGRSTMTVTAQELKERVFQPTCEEIIDFLKRHANTDISAVILVGGLAHSQYVLSEIEAHYRENNATFTQLYTVWEQKRNAAMFEAARGAIYWALENSGPNNVEPRVLARSLPEQHDVLVVIDIDREGVICAFKKLVNNDTELTFIRDWKGRKEQTEKFCFMNMMIIQTESGVFELRNMLDENPLHIINDYYSNRSQVEFTFFEKHKSAIIQYSYTRHTQPSLTNSARTYQLFSQSKSVSENNFYKFHFNQHLFDFIQRTVTTTFPSASTYRYCLCSDLPSSILKETAHPLLIGPDEAISLYCHSLLPEKQRFKHIYFLQLHIQDKCRLLLNHMFATQTRNEGLYKHIESKDIGIRIIDKISEQIWMYVQDQPDVISKCEHHHHGRFFVTSIRDMAIKNIKGYLLKTYLDLEDLEKTHSIYICSNHCRIDIANMDLLDYAIYPVLDHVVDTIQCIVATQFPDIPINDLFIIGKYPSFIISTLSDKLKNNFRIHHVVSDPMDRILGAAIYGTSPTRHLLKRIASKGYAISITQSPKLPSITICTTSGRPVPLDTYIPLLQKHDTLPDTPFEIHFYLSESLNTISLKVCLFEMDEEYNPLHTFYIDKYTEIEHPIHFIATFTQSSTYKFQLTHGLLQHQETKYIQEPVTLF